MSAIEAIDALECLGWYERTAKLYEPRPTPLNLTDTEILDWLGEYCDQALYTRPTPEYRGGFTLYCEDIKTSGETLRIAVCLAAAKLEEANS